MSYLHAHFSNQQSAMAAMDRLLGRGLGRARVSPLVERPSEPNVQPAAPADLGRARLEVELSGDESEAEVRALLGPLGATDVIISEQTGTPFPAQPSAASPGQSNDVERAIRASERGATGGEGSS
jgi:hypothetical protein